MKARSEGMPLGTAREKAHKFFFGAYDRYLDMNRSVAWLSKPTIAAILRQNLYHHHKIKYQLFAYCIMPNHVHVLFQPLEIESPTQVTPPSETDEDSWPEKPDGASPLAKIMHSLKSYTALKANEALGRSGQFWQHESYDHWVRDDDELERIVDYIAWNPVKANLARHPHEWFFSSAHHRFLRDGTSLGMLTHDG